MPLFNALLRALDPLHGVPEATRQAFECWYLQAKIPQIRYVAFLTTALYLICAAIEQNVETDQPFARLIVHALLVPAALLAIGLLSFQPRRQPLMLGLLSLAPIISVLSNLYFNFGSPRFAFYAPEIYLNLMWTFAISGLALKRAMATALFSLAAIMLVTLEHSLTPGMQRLHLIWILASFSFGLLSAFLLEKAHKHMFLHQDSLALSASVDSLTGLWNRSRTLHFLIEEVARANRYGTPFSVVLIDIDHFKSVNDTYGHLVGDRLLTSVAGIVGSILREGDVLIRYGGEEFLAVLPAAAGEDIRAIGERVRRAVEESSVAEGSQTIRVTVSVGGAAFPNQNVEGEQSLVELADEALYAAKQSGRNRVQIADETARLYSPALARKGPARVGSRRS